MEIEMPKDARLYMTFPNDFHRHPKIARLSVAARWGFVELNGEARIADNDGVFDAVDAEFLLGLDVLNELVQSHPTRPLLVRDGDKYVIRDYGEHQQTRAEREALSAKRSKAGRAGRSKQTSEIAEIENIVAAQFEAIWRAWPRKTSKKTAADKWARLSASERARIAPILLGHAAAHAQHTEVQFVPHLSTWLNQERWNDPLPTARSRGTQTDTNASVLGRYMSENEGAA